MTDRETIERLQRIRQFYLDTIKDDTAVEAVDMAIAALEFLERYDRFWEEVKAAGMSGREVEIRHSGRVFKIREVAQ